MNSIGIHPFFSLSDDVTTRVSRKSIPVSFLSAHDWCEQFFVKEGWDCETVLFWQWQNISAMTCHCWCMAAKNFHIHQNTSITNMHWCQNSSFYLGIQGLYLTCVIFICPIASNVKIPLLPCALAPGVTHGIFVGTFCYEWCNSYCHIGHYRSSHHVFSVAGECATVAQSRWRMHPTLHLVLHQRWRPTCWVHAPFITWFAFPFV